MCAHMGDFPKFSHNCGKLPSDWKQALVTPVFKKGSQYYPNNFRPVSLTSQVCNLSCHQVHTQHRIVSQHQLQHAREVTFDKLLTA